MYRKIIISGVTAAAIIGTGTAALAVTGDTASPSAGTGATQQQPGGPGGPGGLSGPGGPADGARGHHPGPRVLKNAEHGQLVVKDKDGNFVTHEFARGVVAGVSAKLIVVHTADGTNQEFIVTSDTAVRLRRDGKGEPGSITDVHLGDHVLVAGTGTGTPVAEHVVDTGTG